MQVFEHLKGIAQYMNLGRTVVNYLYRHFNNAYS